jgi:hypothetical protein
MLDRKKNLLFILSVLNLPLFNKDVLSNTLHCIQLIVLLKLDEEYFPKGTFVNNLQDLKVL